MSKFQIPNSKFQSGFTLIELILYLAIISGAVVSFVYFIIAVSNSRSKTYVAQEVHANGRAALEFISRHIRASNGVDPEPPSDFDTNPGKLSLDFSAVNATKDPTIIDLDANGVLRIKEGAGPTTAVTSSEVKITNLVFTNVTAAGTRENIRINMTIQYNNSSADTTFIYSKSFTTTVSVRQ